MNNYYPTDKPCVVCHKTGPNGIEPRFGYVVCPEHQQLSPVEVQKTALSVTTTAKSA